MKDVSRFKHYTSYLMKWRISPAEEWGEQVLLEQHLLLTRQMLVMAFMSFLISGILAVLLAVSQSSVTAITWLLFAYGWSFMVLLGWFTMRGKPPPKKVSGRYVFKAEISGIYYGLVWGALPFVFDITDPLYMLLIVVMTATMMAGALALVPSLPRIVFRFAIAAFILINTAALMSTNSFGYLVAAGTPALIFVMLYGGRTSLLHLQQLVLQRQEAYRSRKVIFSIVESIQDPFAFLDEKGEILVSNDAYNEIDASTLSGLTNNEEVRSTGQWFLSRVTDDNEVGSVVTLRNITALKTRQIELEEAILEAEEAKATKNRFLSNMSHNFRTPLNVIMGFSSIMGSDSKIEMPETDVKKNIDDIYQSARTLLELLESVFAYTSLENDTALRGVIDWYSLNNIFDAEFEKIRSEYPSKNLELKYVVAEEASVFAVPEPSMRRAIYHMLDVAAKGSNANAELRVVIKALNDKLVIGIQNTGPSMSANELEGLKDPFWDNDNVYVMPSKAAPLSLAYVDHLAETFGGTFKVESQEGVGTLFTLILPQGNVIEMSA